MAGDEVIDSKWDAYVQGCRSEPNVTHEYATRTRRQTTRHADGRISKDWSWHPCLSADQKRSALWGNYLEHLTSTGVDLPRDQKCRLHGGWFSLGGLLRWILCESREWDDDTIADRLDAFLADVNAHPYLNDRWRAFPESVRVGLSELRREAADSLKLYHCRDLALPEEEVRRLLRLEERQHFSFDERLERTVLALFLLDERPAECIARAKLKTSDELQQRHLCGGPRCLYLIEGGEFRGLAGELMDEWVSCFSKKYRHTRRRMLFSQYDRRNPVPPGVGYFDCAIKRVDIVEICKSIDGSEAMGLAGMMALVRLYTVRRRFAVLRVGHPDGDRRITRLLRARMTKG